MKTLLERSLPAALLTALVVAAPAPAATHTIRIEGAAKTLLSQTQVTTPADTGRIPGAEPECDWADPAGPLEVATNGNWNRQRFVTTILGESAAAGASWYFFENGKLSNGACETTIPAGSDIVIGPAPYDPQTGNPSELPTSVENVPARVAPGQAFTVKVTETTPVKNAQFGYYEAGTGSQQPAQGVTVRAGSSTTTTDASGNATLTVSQTGETTVQSSRSTGLSRSKAVSLCVTTGSDGACGTTKPAQQQTTTSTPCATSGKDGLCGSRDLTSPVALLGNVKDRQTFAKGKGPRLLTGKAGTPRTYAPDPSALHAVKLRLTRTVGKRCSTWSKSKERFVKRRCGVKHGYWFAIGTDPSWQYQLAERLPRGRYVLDANAIDKAYNRDDARRRGENRAIFTVR